MINNISAAIISIQVGVPRRLGSDDADDPHDKAWTSGFYKQAVAGTVAVTWTNLAGDGQADLEHHGGRDKAVLAYAAEHYPLWRSELGIAFPPGGFGENLTIAGIDERTVCIGDVWQAGDVELQVTQPRQPCWKLARRWRIDDLAAQVVANGRSGWYLRVLREGFIEPGLSVRLSERPHPEWTVARAADVMHRHKGDRQLNAQLASLPELSASWHKTLSGRA